ncbi:ATP-binding protein [Streptomyces sp. NPDC094466]|uniref:ATP-binding protein n=1 Tax=Streptomyces sp. NPDC094466 TaxID=3366065 RepID=UPI0037F5D797
MDERESGPYRMRISRLTVDKLGIRMYDKVSAVLAELVSNAYDADATDVRVTLPFGEWLAPAANARDRSGYDDFRIVMHDDGHGMTHRQVNEHYLMVGADRRTRSQHGNESPRGRRVMGRKGIGKLAPFGICKTVEVRTAGGTKTEAGYRVSHMIMHLDDMLSASDSEYQPEVGPQEGTFAPEAGTTITLSNFYRRKIPTGKQLHHQLAARFGIRRDDWCIKVTNSKPDAGALPGLEDESSFTVGQLEISLVEGTERRFANEPLPGPDGRTLLLRGWMGFSKEAYKDEFMAGVRIYSRGKIAAVTRNFGGHTSSTGAWVVQSYLVGELHADWLDEEEDLIQSDRQDIIWSSELGEALRKWGHSIIGEMGKAGRNPIRQNTIRSFEKAADLPQRLRREYPGDEAQQARVKRNFRLFVGDNSIESAKDPEHVNAQLERAMRLTPANEILEALEKVAESGEMAMGAVIDSLHDARVSEFYSLGQIAARRVAAIEGLRRLVVEPTTEESALQKLITEAPWLLAPDWTPLGANVTLEKVKGAFERWFYEHNPSLQSPSPIGSPNRRPDFVFLNGPRRMLWIVEIKKSRHQLQNEEFDRAFTYLDSLGRFLTAHPDYKAEFPILRLTFVVDDLERLSPPFRSLFATNSDIEHLTWETLLTRAENANLDFLAKVKGMRGGHL